MPERHGVIECGSSYEIELAGKPSCDSVAPHDESREHKEDLGRQNRVESRVSDGQIQMVLLDAGLGCEDPIPGDSCLNGCG